MSKQFQRVNCSITIKTKQFLPKNVNKTQKGNFDLLKGVECRWLIDEKKNQDQKFINDTFVFANKKMYFDNNLFGCIDAEIYIWKFLAFENYMINYFI